MTREVLSGNAAAAIAVKLARPDVIAAYPITPQTPLVEYLTRYVASGELDAAVSEVESEHSAMSIVQGASLAGGRTFTATSSQGLALMYEPYFRTSTLRLPVVMAIVNREMISPQTVWGAPQDALTLRDAGWVQFYVEDNQEVLDTIIQAFRICEDPRVLLPANVCFDGFYLSHMTECVEVPDQGEVDRFLPPYRPSHVILDPASPMSVDPLTPGDLLTKYRQGHLAAMQRVLTVAEEVDREYECAFGRSWGGAVDTYRLDDAEIALVCMGSMTGAARVAVDRAREKGIAVGLLKVRLLRPFPDQRISTLLGGKRACAVVDRSVSFGRGTGILFQEVRAVAPRVALPFIGGLGGLDITVEDFDEVIRQTVEASKIGSAPREAIWL